MITSSEVPVVSIIQLTEELLPLAIPLVAAYLWPEQEGSETSARAEANLRQLLAWPGTHFFLATSNQTGIGFAAVYWGFSTRQGQPILCIQDLFVLQQARRRGIARTLLHHLVMFARGAGARRLQLQTGTHNLAARALYECVGFEWFEEKETYMLFLSAQ